MLITKAYVKENFPQWEHYAEYDTEAADTDAALDKQIAQAEIELSDYVSVDEDTITDTLKRHLLRIVRKNLFDLKHADTEFDRPPGIVADYNNTIDMLEQLRDGERPAEPATPEEAGGKVNIKAKKRRMNRWFTDTGGYQVDSSDENTP